jgi:hypothetical protein
MTDNTMNLNINSLKFEQNEVGRLIKGSKLIYNWEMVLDGSRRKVELIHSRITGKRRIILDGKVITKAQKLTFEFQYSFMIEKHYTIIIQTAPDSYELRIDNISFSTLLNKEKINNFNKTRKENNITVNSSSEVKSRVDLCNKKIPHTDVHKIEDDFFSSNQNKFSAETNFQENNYFDNNEWNFDGQSPNIKKNQEPGKNFFQEQDFDFNKQTELNTNKLLIVNKNNKKTNESNSNPVSNNAKNNNEQPPQKNLLDFNDVFSGSSNVASSNSQNKQNDLFNLFDVGTASGVNYNNNNLQSNNVNLLGNQPKVQSQVI